jgi:predicted secreted Zn-dependent protease
MRGLPGRGIRVLAAAGMMAALGLQTAQAETKFITTIVEFDVPGTTAAEVHANFFRFGPRDWSHRHAYATTSANLHWPFTYEPTDKGCVVRGVTVTAEITITMPRLVDLSKMSPKLKRAFNAYMKNLMGHERGHEKRFIAAAQRIDKRVRGLPPQPTCEELWQRASAVGFDVFQEADQANRAYDKKEAKRIEGDLKFPTD